MSVKRVIRIKDLSEIFEVSTRAIKYDLENVRRFFEKHSVEVKSRSGKGIWIECSEEERRDLIRILSDMQEDNLYFNQSSRLEKILLYLFTQKNYLTAGSLANLLNVNRNTILKDISKVNALLEKNGFTLHRKQRAGYLIEGSEIELRKFFENLIQKSLSLYDVFLITERIKNKDTSKTIKINLPEIYTKDYGRMEKVVIQLFEDDKSDNYKNDNLVLFIIRFIISILRQNLGFSIKDDKDDKKDSEDFYEIQEVFKENGFQIADSEMLYIFGKYQDVKFDLDISALTSYLIDYVSKKTNFPFYEDNTIYSRILSSLTMNLKGNIEENAFNNVILKNQQQLFLSVKEICSRHINNSNLINNNSFICYIVLEFLISRKNILSSKKSKAIFVCATGIGAAEIIEKMIESEVNNLEVVARCSLMEAESTIKRLKPDYIISVFPMVSEYPVIVVEPIPTKENIEFIKNLVSKNNEFFETHMSEIDTIIDFNNSKADASEVNIEVILIGLKIYGSLSKKEELTVKKNLEFAYLSHIMLLANRIYFKRQFTSKNLTNDSETANFIRKILKEEDVILTDAEICAICNYYE